MTQHSTPTHHTTSTQASGTLRPAGSLPPSRRDVLQGATVAGLGLAGIGTVAGCSSSGSAGATVPMADVPVGGGKIVADSSIVVTQPTEGVFKAFTSICPHQKCAVAKVESGSILCTCHGSAFDATTGAVTQGPATQGLDAKTVTVNGDSLTIS